jgi:hypothetical protein
MSTEPPFTPADAPEALRPEVLPPGPAPSVAPPDGPVEESPVSEIESPGKIIRIGAMVKQLLEEVRNSELDEASRDHLRDIYENSIKELKGALSPDLAAELEELSFDFSGEELPTGTELRLAKAQLVGWLEGLFHGIQATLMAQQMAARQQLEGMRAQLPEQAGPSHAGPGYL